MKSSTFDINGGSKYWIFPPIRPWIEFAIILALLTILIFSIVDLVRKNSELKDLLIREVQVNKAFHVRVDKSMARRDAVLKIISRRLNVPQEEIDEALRKD